MTNDQLYAFLTAHRWAVQASVGSSGRPQAAVVGFVVTRRLELFFDTLRSSRKYRNLQNRPHLALVIGWDQSCTVQVDGIADEPSGAELDELKALYFARFPDGRDRAVLPEIAYLRVRPLWLRWSDFRATPPHIVELPGPFARDSD